MTLSYDDGCADALIALGQLARQSTASEMRETLEGIEQNGLTWLVSLIDNALRKARLLDDLPPKPLTYYGGKQRLASKIIKLMPPHDLYIEPFAGGLAVLMAKPKSAFEVINDRDLLIADMWRALRDDPSMAAELMLTPYARIEHSASKKPTTAWATYINHTMSFGGTRNGGLSSSANKTSSSSWHAARKRIPATVTRLQSVIIENLDAIECIQKYDRKGGLIYCDPPYPGADQGHYAGYRLDDYARLIDTLSQCESSIVLSNYHQDIIIVPKDWRCVEFAATCSAQKETGRRRKRTEVLWIKDRSVTSQKTPSAQSSLLEVG